MTPGYLTRDDPGGFVEGGRYTTGDRVQQNARGEWEFLGRIDWQCKVGGVRVDPDEVAPVEDDELHALLRGHFPRAVTPSLFVHLTRWPTTARGKRDRAALRDELTRRLS